MGMTQAYCGRFSLAEVLVNEGMEIDPRGANEDTKINLIQIYLYSGQFETARVLVDEVVERGYAAWTLTPAFSILSWIALVKEQYLEAERFGQRSIKHSSDVLDHQSEMRTQALVPLGLALHGL